MKKRLFPLLLGVLLAAGMLGCAPAADQLSPAASPDEEDEAPAAAGYADALFDTSYVHKIDVEIAEEHWKDLLENPTEKTKYPANVTIDGNAVDNVSFATKGNTSLTQVAATDSDRYSFKINFGKFVDGQTYGGLDKLNLNNAYSDATYLKDYLSYRIMAEAGVNAPLVSFVSLSINGEIYGLYVAVEEVGDAFLARNYGEEAGELYKPEASQLENMGGGGNMPRPGSESASADGGATPPENPPDADALPAPQEGSDSAQESWPSRPEGSGPPIPEDGAFPGVGEGSFPGPGQGGPGGGFGESTEGASLVYTDDETDSYSDIFDNAETDADDADFERVIAALKQLSTGEDLDAGVDVEAVLRYFVAHNFVINFDSYTGNMLHNYYLYEEGGRLTMLPWDYNLAFGGFNNNTATENVNWPIDSPLSSGVSEQDRPMWSKLAANDSYLDMYHTYFDELIVNYFESGRFEEELDAVSALIRPHVETDPTAFYTLDEFDAAVESLRRFNLLRAESVRGQLDGSIPSTAAGQEQDASALVDASEVNIPAMGSMGGMRGQGGPQRQRPSESTGENADASPPSDQDPSPSPTSD